MAIHASQIACAPSLTIGERVTAIAMSCAESWREACADAASDVTDWPAGFCVDATFALVQELREKVPEARADYVWGKWGHPHYLRYRAGHAWCEIVDLTIIDLTAGQWHFPGSPIDDSVEDLLIVPGLPGYGAIRAWWHEEERNVWGNGRPMVFD